MEKKMKFFTLALILGATTLSCFPAVAQDEQFYELERIGESHPGSLAIDINDDGAALVQVLNLSKNSLAQLLFTDKDISDVLIEGNYLKGPYFLEAVEGDGSFIVSEKYNRSGKMIFIAETEELRTPADFCPSTQKYNSGEYTIHISENAEHAYYKLYNADRSTSIVSCATGKAIKPVTSDEKISRFSIRKISNDGTIYLTKSIGDTVMWAYPKWQDGAKGYKPGNLISVSPNANCILYRSEAPESKNKVIRDCNGNATELPTVSTGQTVYFYTRVNDRGDVLGSASSTLKEMPSDAPAKLLELAKQAAMGGEDEYYTVTAQLSYTFDDQFVFLPQVQSDTSYKDEYVTTSINALGDISGRVRFNASKKEQEAIIYRRLN